MKLKLTNKLTKKDLNIITSLNRDCQTNKTQICTKRLAKFNRTS